MNRLASLVAFFALVSPVSADDFPKPYDSEKKEGKPMPAEEAAAKTGLSIHTIEKYLVEARARLRMIMKEP